MRVFEKWPNYMKKTDGVEQEVKAPGAPQAPVTLSDRTLENTVRAQDGVEAPAQTQSPPEPPAPGCETPPGRGSWGGKHEFLLSCIGYCVGLGNVWRFPYLCYRNGGGVFLIPYCIMMMVTGLPLFLMELSLGQYGGAGPITVWKCCPLLKGIGIGMLVVASLVSLYYNVIIAWTFYYLGSSFQNPLPWSCDAPANIRLCRNLTANQSDQSASEVFWNVRDLCWDLDQEHRLWQGQAIRPFKPILPTQMLSNLVLPSEQVLGLSGSSGLDDPGPVRWPLAICLLAAWVFIFLCCLKGIRSSGKIVYITATFPYLVLIVLIIRGATLQGSLQGVKFYLSANWKRLGSAQVWNDAASQIFYSLGIGFGGLLSMASYNKFDNNVVRDTLIIVTGNCITSFFAGFAIFSILGHMAWKKGVEVSDVADSGPGLAFVAYPEALALLPGSFIWSILFFLMLFTLGIDTLFGNLEGITTAILDEFPVLRERKRKTMFLAVLCFSFYLLGLLLITEGGIYWFTLIDAYSTSFGLIIITLFMCLGIAFFYGVNQFCEDIIDMLRYCPPWCGRLLIYFKACWALLTPLLLLFILMYIFIEMYNTTLHYGSYEYPAWGKVLGVCLGVLCCVQIPVWSVVAVVKESGTLRDRFQKAIRPLNSWKVTGGDRTFTQDTVDVPFSVTLTDHDFTEAQA